MTKTILSCILCETLRSYCYGFPVTKSLFRRWTSTLWKEEQKMVLWAQQFDPGSSKLLTICKRWKHKRKLLIYTAYFTCFTSSFVNLIYIYIADTFETILFGKWILLDTIIRTLISVFVLEKLTLVKQFAKSFY